MPKQAVTFWETVYERRILREDAATQQAWKKAEAERVSFAAQYMAPKTDPIPPPPIHRPW